MSGPLILSPGLSARSFGPLAPSTGASQESQAASANTTSATSAAAQTTGGGGQAPTSGPIASGGSDASAVAWLLAWGVLIVFVVLINRTQLGRTITYYVLVLALLFLLLTQYKFIAAALAPFQESQQAVAENGDAPTSGSIADPSGDGAASVGGA